MDTQEDTVIRSRVRGLIDNCPDLDSLAVGVQVVGGEVRLHGSVGSYAEKLCAAELAAGVVGAGRVRNELEPRPYGADWRLTDEDIAARIRQQLDRVFIPSGMVDVAVDHHVVTLRGTLSSAAERAIVRHLVEDVRGVNIVHNRIAV